MIYWYCEEHFHSEYDGFPHSILLEGANQEGLLKPLQKYAEPTNEVSTWLDENVGATKWKNIYGMIIFTEKESAIAFILKWS